MNKAQGTGDISLLLKNKHSSSAYIKKKKKKPLKKHMGKTIIWQNASEMKLQWNYYYWNETTAQLQSCWTITRVSNLGLWQFRSWSFPLAAAGLLAPAQIWCLLFCFPAGSKMPSHHLKYKFPFTSLYSSQKV